MQELINVLEAKYGADLELREGKRSFQKDYIYEGMPTLRSGGFYPDAFEFDGEDVTVEKTLIGRSDAFILAFSAAGMDWEARVGQVAFETRQAEDAAMAKAEANAAAAAKAEAEAAMAARRARKEPTSFAFDGKIAGDIEARHLEAPAGTFVPGDRVTVPGRSGRAPMELVVTGIGRDYERNGQLVHRGYVMFASQYDALSNADREKLPKTESEATKARVDESKKAAKALGGKSLRGTARQKAWAEEIRKQALSRVSPETAAKLLSGAEFQQAKFWIDNRTQLSAGNVAGLL